MLALRGAGQVYSSGREAEKYWDVPQLNVSFGGLILRSCSIVGPEEERRRTNATLSRVQ